MKDFESIDQTFKAIRQMPLEVSLDQVKKWISEPPKTTPRKSKWSLLKWLFSLKNKN